MATIWKCLSLAFFCALALNGNAQFQTTYIHNQNDDHASLIRTHAGLGFVAASTSYGPSTDIRLMKYDSGGNVQLDVTFDWSGNAEYALAICRGNNDTYIVCGYENSGGFDLGFVMAVDTNFNFIAKRNITVPSNNRHTPALNVINSAFYEQSNPNLYFPGDTNGGYLITGFEAVGYNSTDSKSAYAIKVDNNLNIQWSRKFDSPISVGTPDWDMASAGNWAWASPIGYFITGSGTSPSGEQCNLAALIDINGTVYWSKLYSDNNVAGSYCVAADGSYDDAVPGGELYQLGNFSQTQSGGIIAFNQQNGTINMSRTRYLVASTPDYYNFEFASTCASQEILISGYGLNQNANAQIGTFPYTIRYNKNSPMVDTWWQHYAYPVQSSNYQPNSTIFDVFSTPEQPRIFYPKLFASRVINKMTMIGYEDNGAFSELRLFDPEFDGKDSCEYVDPQIVALPMPIYEWPVLNSVGNLQTPIATVSSTPQFPFPNQCNGCTADANFTITPGANCTYTFNAPNSANLCPVFNIYDVSNSLVFSSSGSNLNFNFSLSGTYTICFEDCGIGTNGVVCRDTKCQTLQVTCPPPCPLDADFSFSVSGCCVNFSDNTPDGNPGGCESWTFGNITSVLAGDNTTFCFPGSGTYTVCHVDCCTNSGTTTYHQVCKQVTVNCTPPCCLPNNFQVTTTNCCATFTPTFPSTGCSALYYYWNFGNGQTSTAANPTHCFNGTGVYNVCMTAYCGKGNKVTICKRVYVTCALPPPPPCCIGTNFTYNYSGTTVSVSNASSFGADAMITGVQWDFGDGTSASGDQAEHYYQRVGTYPITLTVEGIDMNTGTSFTASKTENLTLVLNPACGCIPPPTSAFCDAPTTCNASNTITLNLIDFDGEADVEHQWMYLDLCCLEPTEDFGLYVADLVPIPGAIGQHVVLNNVTQSRSYICRSRSNITGLTTYSNFVYSEVAGLSAELTATDNPLCAGEETTLTVSSSDGTIALTEWIGLPNTTTSISVSPPVSTEYTALISNAAGCGKTAHLLVNVEACPGPPNNSPATATAVVVGNLNTCNAIVGDLTNATPSSQANSTAITGEDLWYSFTASEPGIRIEVTSSAADIIIELQDASGNTLADINDISGIGGEILNHIGLTVGQSYRVGVRNYNSSLGTGTFSLCVKFIKDSGCDYGVGPYTLCNVYKATYSAGASYRFEFTQTTAPFATFTRTQSSDILILSNVPGLQYGYTYSVSITAIYTLSTSTGTQVIEVPQSVPCTMIIGPHPETQLRASDRCSNGPRNRGSVVASLPWVCGVVNWKWEFQEVDAMGMNVGLPITVYRGAASNFISLGTIAQLGYGKTYIVRTAPVFSYGDGSYGPPQNLCIIGSSAIPYSEQVNAEKKTDICTYFNSSELNLYPNPSQGDYLILEISNPEEISSIQVFDMTGKLITIQTQVMNESGQIQLNFNETLPSGAYTLSVLKGDIPSTTRFIVLQ